MDQQVHNNLANLGGKMPTRPFPAGELFRDENITVFNNSEDIPQIQGRLLRLQDDIHRPPDGSPYDRFEDLNQLRTAILKHLDKFTFGRFSIKYWDNNYILPDVQ